MEHRGTLRNMTEHGGTRQYRVRQSETEKDRVELQSELDRTGRRRSIKGGTESDRADQGYAHTVPHRTNIDISF